MGLLAVFMGACWLLLAATATATGSIVVTVFVFPASPVASIVAADPLSIATEEEDDGVDDEEDEDDDDDAAAVSMTFLNSISHFCIFQPSFLCSVLSGGTTVLWSTRGLLRCSNEKEPKIFPSLKRTSFPARHFKKQSSSEDESDQKKSFFLLAVFFLFYG